MESFRVPAGGLQIMCGSSPIRRIGARSFGINIRGEDQMESRISYFKAAPGAREALLHLSEYLSQCGLEESLLDLVCLRASQINGCAFCIDMHWKDLRALGQSEEALYMLDAWREAPGYTERERAALAWTEAVTLVTEGHVPDEVYHSTRQQFSDAELANLTLAIATINSWNRMNIAFRTPAGHYRAPAKVRQTDLVSNSRVER
jgi:AhpD family alkylhydroperoxidase